MRPYRRSRASCIDLRSHRHYPLTSNRILLHRSRTSSCTRNSIKTRLKSGISVFAASRTSNKVTITPTRPSPRHDPTLIISTPPPPSLPYLRSKSHYHRLPKPLSLPHRLPKYCRPCSDRYGNISNQPSLLVGAYALHRHPRHPNTVRSLSRHLLSGPMQRSPAQRHEPEPVPQLQRELWKTYSGVTAVRGRGCGEVVLFGL